MATTSKSGLRYDEFVKNIRPDPKSNDPLVMLQGYIGKSDLDGHVRVYSDPALSDFIDLPEREICYADPVKPEEDPLGGSRLWVRKTAVFTTGDPNLANRIKSSFLEGDLLNAFGAGQEFKIPTIVNSRVCPPPCAAGTFCAGGTFCVGGTNCVGGTIGCIGKTICIRGTNCVGGTFCIGGTNCVGGTICIGGTNCAGGTFCVGGTNCAGGTFCIGGTNGCFGKSVCIGGTICIGTNCAGGTFCVGGTVCGAGTIQCGGGSLYTTTVQTTTVVNPGNVQQQYNAAAYQGGFNPYETGNFG